MSVRVAIAGAGGRMGRALLDAAAGTQGVAIAAALDVTPGRWNDIEITWEDREVDFYVIVNKPRPQDHYVPGRSIVIAAHSERVGRRRLAPGVDQDSC